MATWLKQSISVEIKLGPFVSNTDGFTVQTGLTIAQADVRLAKNEGDWAQKSETTTLVHEENGWYRCLLNTTDTGTLGILVVAVNETGALPVWREFIVLPANIYDSWVLGTDLQDVSTTQFNGSAVVQSGGRPEVNTTHAAGTAWASGAITAAVIATDAIDSDAIAASAVTEINTGIATSAALATVDTNVSTVLTRIGTPTNLGGGATLAFNLSDIEAQTDDIGAAGAGLTALASASSITTLSGFVDTEVAAILAAVDTEVAAIKLKTDNLPTDPADASDIAARFTTLDTAVADLPTNAELATSQAAADDATLAAIAALTIPSAATIADAVWDEDMDVHQNSNTAGEALIFAKDTLADFDGSGVDVSSSSRNLIADAVWDEVAADHQTAGSFGATIGDSAAGIGASMYVLVETVFNDVSAMPASIWEELIGDHAFVAGSAAEALNKANGLTFTVAGQVDSNVQAVNDVTVTGTGAPGDEWGP